MSEAQFTVSHERKLSDGNYGSEGCHLSMTVSGPSEEFTDEWVLTVTEHLRKTVLAILADSSSPGVAHLASKELHHAETQSRRVRAETVPAEDLELLPF